MKKASLNGKCLAALLISLALCFVSMVGTHQMLTDGGNVQVKDLKFITPQGNAVRFLEYRPVGASVENPVPR